MGDGQLGTPHQPPWPNPKLGYSNQWGLCHTLAMAYSHRDASHPGAMEA